VQERWLSKIWSSKTWLSKTWLWLAVFCLVGLAPAIAIKVVAPRVSLVAEPVRDHSKLEPAFTVNELAKADRLELHNTPAEPGIIVLAAKPAPAETPSIAREVVTSTSPSTSPEPVKKIADRHWRDANASIPPAAPVRRHPKIHPESKQPKQSASPSPPSKRAEVWHCRQDAMGSLLRSLDLSPRCNL
jgi:hypothetical protein